MEPEPFIEALKKTLNPQNFLRPLDHAMDFEMEYPEFLRNSYKKRKERSQPEKVEIVNFLESRDSLTDEVSWAVLSRFVGGGPFAGEIIRNKPELMARYGREEVIDKLASLVFNDVKIAIRNNDEEALERTLKNASNDLGEDAEAYKTRYRLYFYQMTKNWPEYARIANNMASSPETDSATKHKLAENILENGTEQKSFELALQWMDEAVKDGAPYSWLETYAALSAKADKEEQAVKYAKMAIEKAEEEGDKADSAQELVNRLEGNSGK
jgi:hypothetical protein